MVDTSGLLHVLDVDTERRTALVEPNVPMDRLVEATLLHSLVPPVVMEFPGITVGGGFAGTAGESSSFKHGFLDRTFNWMEIVLANGDVVKCSDTERHDLFHGAAGSFGTLGVATLFEIRLLEAKEYVELTYHPMTSVSEAIQKIGMEMKDLANDYVDGIVFSLNKAVVMTGRLTNDVRGASEVHRFFRAQDPWFYLHAKKLLSTSLDPVTEAIPLTDYLFRYDRGAFWTGVYAFEHFVTPFNRITRWALDSFMRTRVMYHALHESGHSQRYMIQDLALPFSTVQDFIDEQVSLHPHFSSDKGKDQEHPGMLLNVGVWGPGSSRYEEFVYQNRMLEDKFFGSRIHVYHLVYYVVYYVVNFVVYDFVYCLIGDVINPCCAHLHVFYLIRNDVKLNNILHGDFEHYRAGINVYYLLVSTCHVYFIHVCYFVYIQHYVDFHYFVHIDHFIDVYYFFHCLGRNANDYCFMVCPSGGNYYKQLGSSPLHTAA
ncbi:hypothetical protein B0A49_01160 [Cryomyces minteri]|uniref:Delta(24)-sterol reductase n=1 Tax=Cryomyces minteri TaxID=331657 RepID=A0A4U0XTB9_9PEZI|nr:hypothetical protein B0A49_01160 [Cryomyces minteri]